MNTTILIVPQQVLNCQVISHILGIFLIVLGGGLILFTLGWVFESEVKDRANRRA